MKFNAVEIDPKTLEQTWHEFDTEAERDAWVKADEDKRYADGAYSSWAVRSAYKSLAYVNSHNGVKLPGKESDLHVLHSQIASIVISHLPHWLKSHTKEEIFADRFEIADHILAHPSFQPRRDMFETYGTSEDGCDCVEVPLRLLGAALIAARIHGVNVTPCEASCKIQGSMVDAAVNAVKPKLSTQANKLKAKRKAQKAARKRNRRAG